MFELKLASGKKIIGVAGGTTTIGNVPELLQKVADVDKKYHTVSQLFDATRIAGKEHLLHAARLALIARATKTNFAGSLNIELLCWVAAECQIDRVFEKVGLHKGRKYVALLIIGNKREQVRRALAAIMLELNVERDDKVLEISPAKIKTISKIYSVPQPALKITDIKKLVLERVALLALEK